MTQVSSSVRPIALAWLEQAGERRYVESETRIGRGDHNDIRLVDASVSRDHALIRRVDGVYVISDLDSANGTFVNGQRVNAPRPLSNGDRISLAEAAFTFNVDAPEPAADAGTAPPVSTSISQFLTISGQIDVQNYLQGELRVVTVLFLDLCGFTALSEKMSPEQVTLVINQCFQRLTETAIRFGGFVDKYIGDAMMVLFGAPTSHDDDAERAVRAAIAMQHELATYSERLQQRSGITLQMRVGINTGEVLAGEVGSGQFSAFTVMGDSVNLASRLEGHARIGHILVNETTFQLTKHRIRYGALPPTPIRGKNELVVAYEVLGLAPDEDTAWAKDLAPKDVAPLIYDLMGSKRVESETLDRLTRLCAGSPLVLEEIVSAARASGVLHVVNDEWRLEAAIDVRPMLKLRSLVQAKLDESSKDQRNVLRTASLIGQPWTARLIALALDEPVDLDQTLSHLVEIGLLRYTSSRPDAPYDFDDNATRAVIEASLPQMERRRLHERVALGLQRDYDPTRPDPVGLKRIARHFGAAGKHWQCVEYLLRSADLAVAAASSGAAVEHYRSVLDEAAQVTDKKERTRLIVEVQERIGDALLKEGSLADAQIAFETAASAASPEREAELYVKLAVTGVRRGNPRRVLEITRIVVDQAAMTNSGRATAEALAALSLASQGVIPEALERVERGLQLLADGGDAGPLALTHFAAGRAHFVAGHLALARNELQLSIAARDEAPDRSAVAEPDVLLGLVLCESGELEEAEACIRRVIAAGADRWSRVNVGLAFGRLLAIRGESDRARRHLQEALNSAESCGARELALELNLELASIDELGVDEIRALVDTAVARQLEPIACRARIKLAEALCGRGDSATARDAGTREAIKVAHEAALRSRVLGLALHEALGRRALAQILAQTGNWSHAAGEFRAAAVIQERQGATVELVRTLVAESENEHMYAASPRLDQLRTRLARASRTAEALGIQPEHEKAVRLLAALQE